MHRFRISALVLIPLLASACSSDDAGDGTPQPDAGGDTSITPDTTTPDAAEPDTAEPDTAEPDTAQPDTAEPDAAEPDTARPIVDDFAVRPDADPADILVEFPEMIIESGADVMNCLFLEPLAEDTWVRKATEHQGDNGHHLLLFEAVAQRDAGTIIDCTSEASMAQLMASIFTENFAGGDLPDGHGVLVPAGTQLVVQQHYVNATMNQLRVRDFMVLETMQPEEVETPLNFFALTDLSFSVPNDLEEHSTELNCTVPEDGVQVLLFGPHMHEWGTHLEIERIDGEGNVTTLHQVEEWRADYRDLPPVMKYFEEPLTLNASDTIRLRCTWINDLDRELRFPFEMCATYGYFIAPSGENWICAE